MPLLCRCGYGRTPACHVKAPTLPNACTRHAYTLMRPAHIGGATTVCCCVLGGRACQRSPCVQSCSGATCQPMPVQAYDERQNQMTMDSYLSFSQRFAKFKSKRLQKAVTGITGVHDPELNLGDLSEPSKKNGANGRGRKRKPGPDPIPEEPAEEVRPCSLIDRTGSKAPLNLHDLFLTKCHHSPAGLCSY